MPDEDAAPLGAIPRVAALRYTERFSPAYFDALRGRGDPLADEAVAALAAAGPLGAFHDLFGAVAARADAGCDAARRLLADVDDVPSWTSFEEIELGQRMLAAFPVHMGISLFAGSLCGGAVFQKMTVVTSLTGMLRGASTRRLDETAKMIFGMALPGALRPGAPGHRLLVRVRLLHAALRRFLVDSGRFRHASEVPINQHDLAITLALFGYLNVRSLAKMGVRFTPREHAAFVQMWRYAGRVLGIEEDLLPRSIEEQRAFFYASVKHQGRPDKIPPQTKEVLDAVARDATRGAPALYGATRRFLHQSCRWLSGDEYVTGMQLEDEGDAYWGLIALRALGAASSFAWRRVPGGEDALVRFGRRAYVRALRRSETRRDHGGEYRVRTA